MISANVPPVMKRNLFFVLFILTAVQTMATHLRGGQITIRRNSATSLEYTVTLTVYTVSHTQVKFGGGKLDFGDGSPVLITESRPNPPEIDSLGIGLVTYPVVHTFPGPGFYRVSYMEQNLNEEILNMTNPIETPMYLESGILIDPSQPALSISFATHPIFLAPPFRPYSFSSAPVDTTGAVYNYNLTVPTQNEDGVAVAGYWWPDQFRVNAQTGLVTWDGNLPVPNPVAGAIYIAVKVSQFDKTGHVLLGYVIRTFELSTSDNEATNSRSRISVASSISDPNGKVVVQPGQQRTIKVIAADTIYAGVAWDLFYDSSLINKIAWVQYDSSTLSRKMKVGLLTITSTHDVERDLPYQIILRANANAENANASYQTFDDVSLSWFTRDIDLPVITGIAAADNSITVFPNPFSNELNVGGLRNGEATFFTSTGQSASTTSFSGGRIDTSILPPGFYILVVNGAGGTSRVKLVKR